MVGYQLLTAHGAVLGFGAATQARIENGGGEARWVGFARLAGGTTLVGVTEDGAIASSHPSAIVDELAEPRVPTTVPIVDVAPVPESPGWWVLDEAGGVFCYGAALYHGSIPGMGAPAPSARIVGLASTPTGMGYWILDEAGGVYCFGDAEFHGSTPALRLEHPPAPARAIGAAPEGNGYVVLEADGMLRSFGTVPEIGHACPGRAIDAVGFDGGPDAESWIVVDRRGFVYPVGNAPMFGSSVTAAVREEVVDVATVMSS